MYPPGRGLCPLPPENTRKVWKRLVILGVGFVLLAQTYAGPIAALAATIQTDLFVYQNGDTVTVTGDGFGAAEVVDLVTTDPAATVVNHGSATTDGVGKLTYQFTLTTTVPGLYDVTATGQTSGLTASTQFDPPPTPPTNLRYRDDRSSGSGSASHDSGNVTVGTTSSFTSARYNNNSGAAITLRAFAISGANPGDFAVANVSPAVGTSIANGGAVTFTVTFTPGALGARSGSVEVNAQDANQSSGRVN